MLKHSYAHKTGAKINNKKKGTFYFYKFCSKIARGLSEAAFSHETFQVRVSGKLIDHRAICQKTSYSLNKVNSSTVVKISVPKNGGDQTR